MDKFLELDKSIFEIKKHLDYLMYINPVNLQEEKAKFFEKFKSNVKYNPQFIYELPEKEFLQKLTTDLESLKTKIPVDIDTNLEKIFRFEIDDLQNRVELILNISNDNNISYLSEKIFGGINQELLQECKANTNRIKTLLPNGNKYITKQDLIERVYALLKKAGQDHKSWKVVFDENTVTVALISMYKKVVIRDDDKFDSRVYDSILAHEFAHLVLNANASRYGFKILQYGFGLYEVLDEGIAVLEESEINKYAIDRVKVYYLAASFALQHSFYDTCMYLQNWLDIDTSFTVTYRVKIGMSDSSLPGAFIKDKVYFEGVKLLSSDSKYEDLARKVKFDYRFIDEVESVLSEFTP